MHWTAFRALLGWMQPLAETTGVDQTNLLTTAMVHLHRPCTRLHAQTQLGRRNTESCANGRTCAAPRRNTELVNAANWLFLSGNGVLGSRQGKNMSHPITGLLIPQRKHGCMVYSGLMQRDWCTTGCFAAIKLFRRTPCCPCTPVCLLTRVPLCSCT